MKYDKINREIIQLLQGDLPLCSRPYSQLAADLQVSEEEIIARIGALKAGGELRRMGAILHHHRAGYTSNGMVAWKVNLASIDQIAELMASYREVSHCYHREVDQSFDYPLFTMIHARSDEELLVLVEQLAKLTGIKEYQIVKSIRELKKVSMAYV